MKSLIFRGLGVLAALSASVLSLHAEDVNLVKAGESIGPIRVGVDITQIEKIFGKVSDAVSMGPGARIWFVKSESGKEEEIVVLIRRADDGQHYFVSEVVVTSPDFRTPAGNSTKSDLAAIWKEYPGLAKREAGEAFDGTPMELYTAADPGIGVIVEHVEGAAAAGQPPKGVPTGKCRALVVFRTDRDADFVELGVKPKKTDAD